jgi:transcriptional regulator with XRE-family HTH domain
MASKLKQRRNELGMTVQEVADKAGLSQGYVTKLENKKRGQRGMTIAAAEKLAMALELDDPADVMDLPRKQNSIGKPHHLEEDAEPYEPQADDLLGDLVKKRKNVVTYRIKTDVLNQIDIKRGDVVFLDVSAEAFERLEPMQAVIAQLLTHIDTPEGQTLAMNKTTTIVRQFVPPNLLITNTDGDNAPILNMDVDPVAVRGVILAKHQRLKR